MLAIHLPSTLTSPFAASMILILNPLRAPWQTLYVSYQSTYINPKSVEHPTCSLAFSCNQIETFTSLMFVRPVKSALVCRALQRAKRRFGVPTPPKTSLDMSEFIFFVHGLSTTTNDPSHYDNLLFTTQLFTGTDCLICD